MSQFLSLTATDTASTERHVPTTQPTSTPLRQSVKDFVKQYFLQWDNFSLADFYDLVLAEVEAPLLEMVLQYVNQNQSEAARILVMSRGTLRKKMHRYGLLSKSKKRQNKTAMAT